MNLLVAKPTYLAILAHPDDEFGLAGYLRKRVLHDAQVHLVYATRGERGTGAEDLTTHPSLASLREREARTAARVLGIDSVRFLDYVDSGPPTTALSNASRSLCRRSEGELVGLVTELFDRLHPNVVLTYEPRGWYGHRDHIRLSQVVTAAFEACARKGSAWRPQRLLYSVVPMSSFRRLRDATLIAGLSVDEYELFDFDMKDEAAESVDLSCDVELHWRTKLRALRCHRSQYGSRHALHRLPEEELYAFLRHEYFIRASCPIQPVLAPLPRRREAAPSLKIRSCDS